jgi:Leucine-rich repeat (LRR) protein
VSVDVLTFSTFVSLLLHHPCRSSLLANPSLPAQRESCCQLFYGRQEPHSTELYAVLRVMMSASVAHEDMQPASAGISNMTAERSDMLQPKRPQPSIDTHEQLHSRRPFIPADLVQNTAEYLGSVAGLLSFRGVSTEWQAAVSDAVGFLNGRCWDQLERNADSSSVDSDELWTRLRLDDAGVVAHCAVLCLRSRLTALSCDGSPNSRSLRLFGKTNETLVTLKLQCELLRPLDALSCLVGCVALRELSLQDTHVANESFAGLEHVLSRLHKLDLSGCKQLEAISNLAPAASLRELNLRDSGVESLQGLDKLVALETLDVTGICAEDLSILRQCPRLVTLSAKGDITTLESIIQAAPPYLAHCRLRIDRPERRALNSRSSLFLRRKNVLKFRDFDTAALQRLEEIPSLELLDLEETAVDDVRSLAGCRVLRELRLTDSVVTDVGIIGLERIPTLEVLNLEGCSQITWSFVLQPANWPPASPPAATRQRLVTPSPPPLRRPTSTSSVIVVIVVHRRHRRLAASSVTRQTQPESVSSFPSVEVVRQLCFRRGEGAPEPSTSGNRSSLTCPYSRQRPRVSPHNRTITLEVLNLEGCSQITSVSSLRHCTALRELILDRTHVTDAGIAGLECIVTLTKLSLGNTGITSVSPLRHSPSLRELDISFTAMTSTGTEGLDEIGTLQCLKAGWHTQLDAATLRRCRSLRDVDLCCSKVTDDAVLAALADVSTLETLKLYSCLEIRDVSVLALSVSLRELDLSKSAVCDAGIAGLERILPSLGSGWIRVIPSRT